MPKEIENKPGLPLPKWAMIIVALPTFYMPLAYLFMVVWIIGSMFLGYSFEMPDWMTVILKPSLVVTFVMWPFYLLWVVVCKRLKWSEKALWMLVVIGLNMIGMPMFYIFITRRYLGKEGQISTKNENGAESLLVKCNTSRAELNPEEWRVWVAYCREVKVFRLWLIPMFLMAVLMLYTAIWYVNDYKEMFYNSYLAETVNIDTQNTGKKILSDIQVEKLHAKASMMAGIMAGAMVSLAIFIISQSIGIAYWDWHRKAFMNFLKARNKSTQQIVPPDSKKS